VKSDKFKGKSFEEIAGEYGEEAAINAGIAADPDTYELDEEWIKEARPASEVIPDIVQRYQLLRERELADTRIMLSIPLEAALAEHIRSIGPAWEEVVNEKLRRAFFGS
jgi:uncharacterized protein (DUF4415 family)